MTAPRVTAYEARIALIDVHNGRDPDGKQALLVHRFIDEACDAQRKATEREADLTSRHDDMIARAYENGCNAFAKSLDDGNTITSQKVLALLAKAREEGRAEAASLRVALEKINAIRNSIVGRQAFHFSMHAYPLVAALDEAGFKGEGYEISRAKAKKEIAAFNAEVAKEIATARAEGVTAGYELACTKIENHCCVSSCCDAQPSGGEAKELARCLRRNAPTGTDVGSERNRDEARAEGAAAEREEICALWDETIAARIRARGGK